MYRTKNSEFTSTMRVLVCLLALVGFLCAVQRGLAQSSNGQVTGLVTDSTGAAVEAARINEAVDEGGAVMQLGILVEGEKLLQGFAPLFKLGHLPLYICRFGAHFGVGLAGQVDVPAHAEKNDGRCNAHEG